MKSKDFLDKLNQLEREGVVDEVRDLMQVKNELEEQLEDLDEEHRKLSPEDHKNLQQHDSEIAEQHSQNVKDISNAEYSHDDPEEAETAREMDLNDAQTRYDELIAGNRGPAFAEALSQRIEEIDGKLENLVDGKPEGHPGFR